MFDEGTIEWINKNRPALKDKSLKMLEERIKNLEVSKVYIEAEISMLKIELEALK